MSTQVPHVREAHEQARLNKILLSMNQNIKLLASCINNLHKYDKVEISWICSPLCYIDFC